MEARRTPTTADESSGARLETIDATIGKTDGEIARLRSATVELSRRRAEVEQVRDKFRRTGYDHPQTTFENEGAISDTLGNILEGVVRSGVLWELLRQGYKSRPTRGQPGLRRGKLPVSVSAARWFVGQRRLAGRRLA